MDSAYLGRTGVAVSRLFLGTAAFGPVVAETEAHTIIDRAVDRGITVLDTAGGTEHIIGRWFATRAGRRDTVVLATSVHGAGLSALSIRRACEEALRRLQTDHIDLYEIGRADRHTSWDEIWQAMDTLVEQGKVVHVGASGFGGWEIAAANEAAMKRHSLGLVSARSPYNLLERGLEREVLPVCGSYGVGLIAGDPLAGGLLAAGPRRAIPAGRRSRVEAFEAFCTDLGERPADVAYAWLLAQPDITGTMIAPRNVRELDRMLRAADIALGGADLDRLDAIAPGPALATPFPA